MTRRLTFIAIALAAAVSVSASARGLQNPPRTPDGEFRIDPHVPTLGGILFGEELTPEAIEKLSRLIEQDVQAANQAAERAGGGSPPPTAWIGDGDQDEASVLDEIEQVPVISILDPRRGGERHAFADLIRRLIPSPVARLEAATDQAVRMLFVNRGSSTGDVFTIRVINHGSETLRLDPQMIVLRPLKPDASRKTIDAFAKSGSATAVKAAGYCLEFRKKPPSGETVYVVAPMDAQKRFNAARLVFGAARLLRDAKRLTPQGDPAAYFHSIRQWAWWTVEQKFTQKTYTEAFVEYTRKNLAAAGQAWTKDREAYVRHAAAGRWADISRVLALAAAAQAR